MDNTITSIMFRQTWACQMCTPRVGLETEILDVIATQRGQAIQVIITAVIYLKNLLTFLTKSKSHYLIQTHW